MLVSYMPLASARGNNKSTLRWRRTRLNTFRLIFYSEKVGVANRATCEPPGHPVGCRSCSGAASRSDATRSAASNGSNATAGTNYADCAGDSATGTNTPTARLSGRCILAAPVPCRGARTRLRHEDVDAAKNTYDVADATKCKAYLPLSTERKTPTSYQRTGTASRRTATTADISARWVSRHLYLKFAAARGPQGDGLADSFDVAPSRRRRAVPGRAPGRRGRRVRGAVRRLQYISGLRRPGPRRRYCKARPHAESAGSAPCPRHRPLRRYIARCLGGLPSLMRFCLEGGTLL